MSPSLPHSNLNQDQRFLSGPKSAETAERLRGPAHQVPAPGTGHAAGVQEDLA